MDFPEAFKALTGNEPFAWQERLYAWFRAGPDDGTGARRAEDEPGLPDALDLPTGLGKTSVIPIWLIALAAETTEGSRPRLPRRLVYVVDRRAVVDQATEVAEGLRTRLAGTSPDLAGPEKELLGTVRAALARLAGDVGQSGQAKSAEPAGDGTSPLAISTLRGQFADNREWSADPARAAIIVGTVDMIGSRLLFSGYGVSRRMRPVHAALLGTDALLVLDEAHLVPPFEALVQAITAGRSGHDDLPRGDWRAPDPVPPLRIMSLSATGTGRGHKIFKLRARQSPDKLDEADQGDEDDRDREVRQRLDAAKSLAVTTVPAGELAQKLADTAWSLAVPGNKVVVFCDSRKIAQQVKDLLDKASRKELKADSLAELLVGARRVRERQKLAESEIFRRFVTPPPKAEADSGKAAAAPASPAAELADKPAFLIATSAGEVGIDLDADHMVCDLVAWERMIQRLGRVNRRGLRADSRIEVFAAEPDKEAETYDRKPNLAERLAPFESELWPADAEGRRSASPRTLRWLKHEAESSEAFREALEKATTPEPLRPALTRPLIDAWAMTSLEIHPGRPNVAPWIRGWLKDDPPQTRVVWRRHLPLRAGSDGMLGEPERVWKNDLDAFFDAASPHLSEVLETETHRVVDLLRKRAVAWLKKEKARKGEPARADEPDTPPVVVVLDHDGKYRALLLPERLQEQKPDQIHRQIAGRTVVVDARLGGLDANGLLDPSEDETPPTIDGSIEEDGAETRDKSARRKGWTELGLRAAGFRVVVGKNLARPKDWALEWRWQRDPDAASEESEELRVFVWRGAGGLKGDPALARSDQLLDVHHAWAGQAARDLGRRLGLGEAEIAMLVACALIHDTGKARPLWQRAMGAPPGQLCAKSKGRGLPKLLEIGGHIYRHEFGTLRDILREKVMLDVPAERRDLALHLIAAHHGHARPVIAPVDPLAPTSMTVEAARCAALRFARLQENWGPWGLAWWEVLLKGADWAASARLDEAPAASTVVAKPEAA